MILEILSLIAHPPWAKSGFPPPRPSTTSLIALMIFPALYWPTKSFDTETRVFSSEDMRREMIRSNLKTVINALNERGYNAVHQIAGYLISNDPAYISSHKNARNIIQQVERDEIIEELVKSYLEKE